MFHVCVCALFFLGNDYLKLGKTLVPTDNSKKEKSSPVYGPAVLYAWAGKGSLEYNDT